MIISFIIGILKKPWWWVIFVIVLGTAFDVFRGMSNYEWHEQVGIEPYNGRQFAIGALITTFLDYAIYGVGLLVGLLWRAIAGSKSNHV